MKKVAILQHALVKGGRLSVVAKIIRNLNKRNIVPDLIVGSISFNINDVEVLYGFPIETNVIDVNIRVKHFHELQIIAFNKRANKLIKNYDLVINSTNTSHFLSHPNLIEYLHYPRLKRIIDGENYQDRKGLLRVVKYLDSKLALIFYQTSKYPKCTLFTNSYYSLNSFNECFPKFKGDKKVWYPPVEISSVKKHYQINNKIISLGRFHSSKNQLEIIKIAETMPNFQFSIVGFAKKGDSYLEKCKKYIAENNISNVNLYTNISYQDKNLILAESSFFLHLLKNEPFGISTVQAIDSGCIPIVPNWGGQIEVVNNKRLRFDSFEQISSILESLLKLEEEKLVKIFDDLKNHIRNFSEENFDVQFEQNIQV